VIQIASALHDWLTCASVSTNPQQGSVGKQGLNRSDIISGIQRSETKGLSGVHHGGSNHLYKQAVMFRIVNKHYFANKGAVP
jgi:hypothetical protein